MKELNKRIFSLILAVLLSSLFFIGLNRFDNKYTHESIQAKDGLLALSAQDMADNPIRYLVDGWAFYPGALLTPEDFAGGDPNRYMVYTSIGERTHLDDLGARNDPHGSGSYVLHLRLPKGLATYALDLPEVFSAYRLYVDDRLYLEMGNPDPDQYASETQRRLVTFDADGKATILLAVSDYSHFYSGLVYPPAFGTPLTLNTARGILLGVCLLIDTLGLVAAVLALYVGLRMKHKNALLFSLTCLTMCGFTSYALLHSAAALPVFPWYAFELALGYLLTLLVVLLHNRICDVDERTRRISAGVIGAFGVLALCYGLFSSVLTVPVKELFSAAVFAFKGVSALYLLTTAGLSLKGHRAQAEPVFYASVFYATGFVWDRIFPEFEPMLFGWFSEWGSLALVLAIGYTLWRDITSAYAHSLAFAEEHRQVSRQLAMQVEYAKQISLRSEENSKINHDHRQHLRTAASIAEKLKESEDSKDVGRELIAYLQKISEDSIAVSGIPHDAFSQNIAIDALLQYYLTVAMNNKIETTVSFDMPPLLPTDVELCTVLGNLLENAVEACLGVPESQRKIDITAEQIGREFYLRIENSFDGIFIQKSGRYLSKKRKSLHFGIGLESVREIALRYGGMLTLEPEGNNFCAGVVLPVDMSALKKTDAI